MRRRLASQRKNARRRWQQQTPNSAHCCWRRHAHYKRKRTAKTRTPRKYSANHKEKQRMHVKDRMELPCSSRTKIADPLSDQIQNPKPRNSNSKLETRKNATTPKPLTKSQSKTENTNRDHNEDPRLISRTTVSDTFSIKKTKPKTQKNATSKLLSKSQSVTKICLLRTE